eukprot:1151611-Pelagomonas_calceolata.AAC.5
MRCTELQAAVSAVWQRGCAPAVLDLAFLHELCARGRPSIGPKCMWQVDLGCVCAAFGAGRDAGRKIKKVKVEDC